MNNKIKKIIGLVVMVAAIVFMVFYFINQKQYQDFQEEMGGGKPLEDKRVQITDQKDERFKSLVMINNSSNIQEYGTGYLLGKDTVVTNKHVVEAFKDEPEKMEVNVGYKDENGKLKLKRFGIEKVIMPKAETIDVAILKLKKDENEKSIDEFIKPAQLGDANRVKIDDEIKVIGYSGDKEFGTLWDSSGKVSQIDGTFMMFRAMIAPGNSGSPIFDKDGKVIGMANAGGDNVSFGFLLKDEILDFIKENIK